MVIGSIISFYIALGEPDSEDILIEFLNTIDRDNNFTYDPRSLKGIGENLANLFLNCGNTKLKENARKWAMKYGYTIIEQ